LDIDVSIDSIMVEVVVVRQIGEYVDLVRECLSCLWLRL
jgi:hypothetical protein